MSLKRVLSVILVAALSSPAASAADENPPFILNVAAPWHCEVGACKLNLTVTNTKDGVKFSLDAEDKEYVAVAISGSGMMGNDSVIECVKPASQSTSANKAIEVYHSSNSGPPYTKRGNTRDKTQDINQIAMNITGGLKDGHIFCSFMLKPVTTFPQKTVDFNKYTYFLQIVSGEKIKENRTGIGYHNMWASTLRAVSLIKYDGNLRTADNVKVNSGLRTTPGWFLPVLLVVKMWL